MSDPNMQKLDELLAHAARQTADVPDDLMVRVLVDAAAMTPRTAPVQPIVDKSIWARVLDVLGGWPALSGLATAGIAGLWIGVAPPASLEAIAADMFGTTQTVDFLDSDASLDFAGAFDG